MSINPHFLGSAVTQYHSVNRVTVPPLQHPFAGAIRTSPLETSQEAKLDLMLTLHDTHSPSSTRKCYTTDIASMHAFESCLVLIHYMTAVLQEAHTPSHLRIAHKGLQWQLNRQNKAHVWMHASIALGRTAAADNVTRHTCCIQQSQDGQKCWEIKEVPITLGIISPNNCPRHADQFVRCTTEM